jgi:hypothetical protein
MPTVWTILSVEATRFFEKTPGVVLFWGVGFESESEFGELDIGVFGIGGENLGKETEERSLPDREVV